MKNNNSSIKPVVAVGIGAALFFVLGRFVGFPKLKDTTLKPTLTLLPNNTILEVKPYETPYILRI